METIYVYVDVMQRADLYVAQCLSMNLIVCLKTMHLKGYCNTKNTFAITRGSYILNLKSNDMLVLNI